MRSAYLLILFLFVGLGSFAQQLRVSGRVTDTAGAMLPGASVKIKFGNDSLLGQTNKEGAISVHIPKTTSVELSVSMVGFAEYLQRYTLKPQDTALKLGNIVLAFNTGELDNVVVTARQAVKVMEDTIQYDVASFKVRDGAPAEDVIKKLPGITVDKDGKITSQGKPVTRVRVNGKDFFGGDVLTATQNLPVEILDNIQVIEDYGEQANLTGLKMGDPETIININIKPNKKRGYFGSANASVGTNDRYVGGLMANLFKEERQISLLGSINNTNSNTFDFNGGGRGGGARGGNNMGSAERGGAGGNGFTTASSAGFNYRDKWGKNISAYGSYSFSNRINSTNSATQSQDINPFSIRFTNSLRNSHSTSTNHRLTFNLEYAISPADYLKFSPFISLAQSNTESSNITEINKTRYYTLNNGTNGSKTSAPNGGGSLVYNHKFKKPGRNFNITTTYNYSDRDQDNLNLTKYRNIDSAYTPPSIQDTLQQQMTDLISTNITTNVKGSLVEPIGNSKTKFLELNYEYNQSATNNNRQVYDLQSGDLNLNVPQSNHYEYQFITNRIGLNYKETHEKFNYNVGIVSQPSELNGQSVGKNVNTHYTNMNWIPSARFVYNLGKNHTLSATYGGRSREPNFMQLQPVADSSNLNNILVGNPDLKADFTNSLAIKYNKTDRVTGRTLFANLGYDRVSDRIVSSRYNNPSGTGRTTTYINTDGFYSFTANGSYTHPFLTKKLFATARMDASYDNNISYTDKFRNQGRNWNLRPGASLRVDINDIVDLDLNAGYTFYKTTTKYATYTNTNKAKTLQFGLSGKNYFFKNLTIGYDVNKSINYGFSSASSVNPLIVNVYSEYRFLKGKKATIRLQGYDLLNENTGISRNINESTITDRRDNRLSRYFLLSFKYQLQKFGGGVKAAPGGGMRRGYGGNI
ncbi:MAG TPA: outer membrane beta-barrel protein [Phnomibacter sp.]|nr:outer membrane beta-barrel protein [Phnomibacter sp.]